MDLLDKMTTYVRVVEAGSFSAAAKQLRLSAAAVSRQIATLEEELGADLIRRSTRRMTITASGREYHERCLRVLREVEEAQAVGRGEKLEGLLKVSAPVPLGQARVVPQIAALMARYPALRIELTLEDRRIDLALEGVDVAIRAGGAPPGSADLVAHRLWEFRRVLVATPEYLSRKGEPRTLAALGRHPGLTYVVGSWTVRDGAREGRIKMDPVFSTNAISAIHELALAGAGIAVLPDWLVAEDLKRKRLRQVLASWQAEPVLVHALHRTLQRGEPRVRALVEHLRAAWS